MMELLCVCDPAKEPCATRCNGTSLSGGCTLAPPCAQGKTCQHGTCQ